MRQMSCYFTTADSDELARTIPSTIYVSDNDTAPRYPDSSRSDYYQISRRQVLMVPGVSKLAVFEMDFSLVPNQLVRQERGTDGRLYRSVYYKVEVLLSSAAMEIAYVVTGKRFPVSSVNFV
jgi:hypothetical protein